MTQVAVDPFTPSRRLHEKGGIRIQAGTGTLWRIRRDASTPAGDRPSEPVEVPFYLAQYALWIAGLAALLAAVAARGEHPRPPETPRAPR